uniref:C-type lectin domain-containing protein n=1 Tax=Salmo trutta TaxID=8032 RepID=A0A674CY08_SALTR
MAIITLILSLLFLVDERPALHSQPFRVVAVCLGVLCVLLVSAIIGLYVYCEYSDYSNVSTANLRLAAEKEALSRERDRLNWSLRFIYQFEDFPVKRKCNPCRSGWTLFKSSCYQILYPSNPWKTWEQSRENCKQNNADLVVIGNQKEQEFIHNHTQYYFDMHHGYWIGLSGIANISQWLWVNGSQQTDGFWKRQTGGNCVLTVPKNAPLANWNAESCSMLNRWICESRALIWHLMKFIFKAAISR